MQDYVITIGRNAGWNIAAALSNGILGIAASALVARSLGPEQQGHFSYLIWLIVFLAGLINLGLPNAANKYIAEFLGRNDTETSSAIVRWLLKWEIGVVTVVTVVLAGAAWLGLVSETWLYFLLAALALMPMALSNLLLGAIRGIQAFKKTTLISITTSAIQLGGFIAVLRLGWGIAGLLTVVILVNAIMALLAFRSLSHVLPFLKTGTRLPSRLRKRIWRYAASVFAIFILDMVVWQRSEVFFLERYAPIQEVAYYSLAFGIAFWAVRIPRALADVLMPAISNLVGQSDFGGIREVYRLSTRYLAFIAIPISFGGAALARPLARVLYGDQYLDMVPALQIVMLGSFFGVTIGATSAAVLYGSEHQGFIVQWGSIVAVLNLVLDMFLIPSYGSVGAAIANVVAQSVASLGQWIYLGYWHTYHIGVGELLKIVSASTLMAGSVWLISQSASGLTGLLLGFCTGIVLYPFCLFLTRCITDEDRAVLAAFGRYAMVRLGG